MLRCSVLTPLLDAGVRVFEWNGSMMHAKTAVADGRWARVGSSNLNIASWLGNCEIDIVIENDPISRQLEVQYERDLGNATEIVLTKRPRGERSTKRQRVHGAGGSSSRAAAGVLRLAHNMSAALGTQRVLGRAEANTLPWATVALLSFAVVAIVWPRAIAWPLAVVCALLGFSLFAGFVRAHKAAASRPPAKVPAATTEAAAESAPPSKL
jgi:cardiolipin synthase